MSASLPINIIHKYKGICELFFETGTSEGDSIFTALQAGFEQIISVEIDPDVHFNAFRRFSGVYGVEIILGNSVEILKKMVPALEYPTMFFLDAHEDSNTSCTPVEQELKEIAKAAVPKVIIIDDMRITGLNEWKNISRQSLTDLALRLFPSYSVTFEDNEHAEKDLMVIYAEEK